MERVRKLVSAPDEIGGGQAKVTVAVLDTGECVMVLHRAAVTRAGDMFFEWVGLNCCEFKVSVFCIPDRLTFCINNCIINK